MTYAAHTKVPVDRSKIEIERTLKRYGADRFLYASEGGKAIIVFEARDRRLRFDLPLPEGDSVRDQQVRRQRWRALLLCIKAKLEAVEAKIETFEEAFLAHVVLPDGKTVGEHARCPLSPPSTRVNSSRHCCQHPVLAIDGALPFWPCCNRPVDRCG